MITYERQTFGPADLFRDLRDRQVLFDGKLASNDPSEQSLVLRCHRVVLAAVSRPLEERFRRITDPEQIIYIPYVGYNSLNYILKLVYEGFVKVKEEENEAFCAAMRCLAIKMGNEIDKTVYCLDSPSVMPVGLLKTGSIQHMPNIKRDAEGTSLFRGSSPHSLARIENERPVREVRPTTGAATGQAPQSSLTHAPRSSLPTPSAAPSNTLFGTRSSQDGPDIKVRVDVGGGRSVQKRLLPASDPSSTSSFRANFLSRDHEFLAAKRTRPGDSEESNAFWLAIMNPVSTTEHAVLDKYQRLGLVRFVGSFQAGRLLYLRFGTDKLRAEAEELIRRNEPVLDPRVPPPKWKLAFELEAAEVDHTVDLAGHDVRPVAGGRYLRLDNYNPNATQVDFCRLLRKNGFNNFSDNNVKLHGAGICIVLFDDAQELDSAVKHFHNLFISGYKVTAAKI